MDKDFLDVMDFLGPKLGPLLIQLPYLNGQKFDLSKLYHFRRARQLLRVRSKWYPPEMVNSILEPRLDTQLVELAGRNWLASQLQRIGIEVARPERDRGIDLIAYIDRDQHVDKLETFIARPIQMKAASRKIFSLDPKYESVPGLILTYVWNVATPSETVCFALTYREAFSVAEQMGYTNSPSWLRGGRHEKRGYTTTSPGKDLCDLLAEYEMNGRKWWARMRDQQ